MNKKDVEALFNKPINDDDQFIVKVFDPIKAETFHKNYRTEQIDTYYTYRKAYLCKKLAYENLSNNGLFNSMLTKNMYLVNSIGEHYHALGLFIILKYIEQAKEKHIRFPIDRKTYKRLKLN